MKKMLSLFGILLCLSALAGWLLSKPTFAGRTGINLFYKEYRFLQTWWQGGLAVLSALLIIMLAQWWVNRQLKKALATIIHVCLLLACITGLVFTYQDFRNDFSHRLLGERFHIGAYLFWIGGILISLFFLFVYPPRKIKPDHMKHWPAAPQQSHL